ncbi:MAG: BamA/TamA family outer membrane protein [Melioribacteraceae bacterium]|nr:BamA/TamA family outer membrane protein [Melioribacteraceae bacterium]
MKKTPLLVIIFCLLSISIYSQNRLEIDKIEFIGNTAIPAEELEKVILSKESPNWFLQLLNKVYDIGSKPIYYDSNLVRNDLGAIKSLFAGSGYFKSKFWFKDSVSEDKESVILRYFIDERDPAIIDSFVVTGLEKIDPEYYDMLMEYSRIEPNTVYKDNIVEEKKNYILSFLRDHGFMFVKVDRPQITIDTVKNSANILLNFEPGRRYKISNIVANRSGKGADLVDDDLLIKIVGIKPESWYSYYDIQRGQVRLYRTNLFTSAIINSVISDTVGNRVPLSISADVGLLYEIAPEIIINNEDNTFNLGLGLNFIRKNFLGNARKFTAGASSAAQNVSEFIKNPSFADSTFYGYADTRISFEQPFLFGQLINTKFESYYTLQKRKNEYNSTLYGVKLSLDFELPQKTFLKSVTSYFNVERNEYLFKKEFLINLAKQFIRYNTDIDESLIDTTASLVVESSFGGQLISQSTNATLGTTMGTNYTDNLFFPTRGYTLSLILEDYNSIPYLFSQISGSNFQRPLSFKAVFTGTYYLPVYSSPNNAFGTKLKIGQIFTYRGNKADVSLNQRLYAGGSNSIRGWATRELVPTDAEYSLSNPSLEELEALLINGATTGGFFILEGSIETRNRLFGNVSSALFVDYGNTWNSSKSLRFDEIAIAAGFGFRYYTEYMPFRIDFGFKIYDPNNRKAFYKKQFWSELLQFHIGIGEAF